jgi:hypothetical protein
MGHGSWDGLESAMPPMGMRFPMRMSRTGHSMMTLVDTSGRVIIAGSGFYPGQTVGKEIVSQGYPIQVNKRFVRTASGSTRLFDKFGRNGVFEQNTKNSIFWRVGGDAPGAFIRHDPLAYPYKADLCSNRCISQNFRWKFGSKDPGTSLAN